jgi:hypothetical protein
MEKIHPIIRWIVLIPGSILGGWAVYLGFMLAYYIKPYGGLAYVFSELSASGASGAATIYLAFYIAPSYQKRVVIAAVVICLLVMVLTIMTTGVLNQNLIVILNFVAQNVGIFAMAWYLYKNKL